jgi:hypothetical protein
LTDGVAEDLTVIRGKIKVDHSEYKYLNKKLTLIGPILDYDTDQLVDIKLLMAVYFKGDSMLHTVTLDLQDKFYNDFDVYEEMIKLLPHLVSLEITFAAQCELEDLIALGDVRKL